MERNGSIYSDNLANLFLALLSRIFCALHILQRLYPTLLASRLIALYSCPAGQCVLAFCRNPFALPPSANPDKSRKLSGEQTLSKGSPRLTRSIIVSDLTPISRAIFDGIRTSPLITNFIDRLVFRDCSVRVAHLQLSGEYPLLLSIRSIEQPCGFSPISLAKA